MRIFKFGGASIKDADGVKNLLHILNLVGHENTLLVTSAMGKTTNALEDIIESYQEKKSDDLKKNITKLKTFHFDIINDLFEDTHHKVYVAVEDLLSEMNLFFTKNKSPHYDFVYDQIIGYGELLSTTIISHFLMYSQIPNQWIDVRNCIKTNSQYRDAKVDWEQTSIGITREIDTTTLNITQGFIGSDYNNFTTTLGREGSDYTAAIFGYCLEASEVTIWKDVPGVLNADPRYFEDTQLLKQIPYNEAIELAFYGASVIHPKTLQPLKRKKIPLLVKSFINPLEQGSCVSEVPQLEPMISCFIIKKNQVCLSISTLDFSFMVEDNISEVFKLLSQYQMKVDLIQNSAISFSLCFDDKFKNLEKLVDDLEQKFKVSHTKNVNLYTIKHARNEDIEKIQTNRKILLKQRLENTVQIVTKD